MRWSTRAARSENVNASPEAERYSSRWDLFGIVRTTEWTPGCFRAQVMAAFENGDEPSDRMPRPLAFANTFMATTPTP